jgi:hypothetical protein
LLLLLLLLLPGFFLWGYKPHTHEGMGIPSHERGKREGEGVLTQGMGVCVWTRVHECAR